MAKLEQVVKGIKSDQVKHGKQQSPKLPITPELLLRIKGVWEREPPGRDKAMLWVAASLWFFGFLRSGEVCIPAEKAFDEGAHLLMKDVQVDNLANPQTIQVKIKHPKLTPSARGCWCMWEEPTSHCA